MFFKLNCILFCFMFNEAYSQMGYKTLPTQQCIEYIGSFGLKVEDWDPSLSIPSQYGLLFTLPNKEIVLIPTRIGMPYDGFIYKNKTAFERMVKEDFFPVSEQYLTYWEIERNNLNNLPGSVPYFENLLKAELKLDTITRSQEGLENIYALLVQFIKQKKPTKLKERVLLAYALVVMEYLVQNKGAEWKFNKKYEVYNSYSYPLVILDDEWKSVVSYLSSTLEEPKGNYRSFKERVGL